MLDELLKIKSEKNIHVVAIIPARGGSKGLTKKNIRPVLGKPLIAYSIDHCKACPLIDRVVVTTDDPQIQSCAIEAGAESPFQRPDELSGDDVACNPVIQHALETLEKMDGRQIDIVVYLQPTEIFRQPWMFEECIGALLKEPETETAFVAYATHKNFWKIENGQAVRITPFTELGRQKRPPIYREDTGVACATRRSVVLQGLRIGEKAKIIPHEDEFACIDIHYELDLKHTEACVPLYDFNAKKAD